MITKEQRKEWLEERGFSEKNVLFDEYELKEYVMVEPETADEGEPEDYKPKKVYLPD